MSQVYVICEGQTEFSFVTELLAPELAKQQEYLTPREIGTSAKKGGNVTYERLLTDLKPMLLAGNKPFCTTLVDYYGLPESFPGKRDADRIVNLKDKADCIYTALLTRLANENRLNEYILRRFVPYVQMHEFEALLFSDPSAFARAIGKPSLESKFARIRNDFATPEHIDNSPSKAPSKRVAKFADDYEKPTMGTLAAMEIGLDTIRQSCPLFSAWLDKLAASPTT